MRSNREPLVYAIQPITGGPVKIGQTRQRGLKRRREMQSGCPFPLMLLAETFVHSEADLHDRLSTDHLWGEWFYPSADVAACLIGFESQWNPCIIDFNVGEFRKRWMPPVFHGVSICDTLPNANLQHPVIREAIEAATMMYG